MKLQFNGTLKQLQDLLQPLVGAGRWEEKPHGVYMLRLPGRVQVHWSSTKGTIWFSGGGVIRDQRPTRIQSAIEHWGAPPSQAVMIPEHFSGQASPQDDDYEEDFGLEPEDWLEDDD